MVIYGEVARGAGVLLRLDGRTVNDKDSRRRQAGQLTTLGQAILHTTHNGMHRETWSYNIKSV